MQKTILITGATDGIGQETAKALVADGQYVLVHGRNSERLDALVATLSGLNTDAQVEAYLADLSSMEDVEAMAKAVLAKHSKLDVLINNAGVLKTPKPYMDNGMDVRFLVNTLAPYLLTQRLMPLLGKDSRVINLSSAAQSPVNPDALTGKTRLGDDMKAYSQSKLAITMWSRHMGLTFGDKGPIVVSVNPGSLLATKMVKEGFGMDGHDVNKGVDILMRGALSDEFANATGLYYDNDAGRFGPPHPDALNDRKCMAMVGLIESVLAGY